MWWLVSGSVAIVLSSFALLLLEAPVQVPVQAACVGLGVALPLRGVASMRLSRRELLGLATVGTLAGLAGFVVPFYALFPVDFVI